MDNEFAPLKDDLPKINLNSTAADEHVSEIERQIRAIKERSRAIRSTLPFKRLPVRIIIELMNFVTLWLNDFPPSSGVSDTFSPRTIMTGITLDFAKHYKVPFGAYVETHEENKPTNTMVERTRRAICLGPSSNFQGSYKLVCLRTGRKIIRKQFREVPMPTSVMKRVAAIAFRDKRPGNMEFTDRNRIPITDDDDDDGGGGDALAEADTAGVNYPDLGNTDNPPGLLIEPDETNPNDGTAYDHDNIPAIPAIPETADYASSEGHGIPGVDPEEIP
jgi:hypothetical protein